MSTSDLDLVHSFTRILSDEGDMFFSSGDISKDAKLIRETINLQGYWAGVRVKYFFDKNYDFLRTEERQFGK